MGLTAGTVPVRVSAPVKQELLNLVDYAGGHGFSGRWACRQLGLDHARMLDWRARAAAGDLADATPGPVPGEALHALLDWERAANIAVATTWEMVDLPHRKLANRGWYLGLVFVAEPTA